jgi:PAS domain S-box-containing protein
VKTDRRIRSTVTKLLVSGNPYSPKNLRIQVRLFILICLVFPIFDGLSFALEPARAKHVLLLNSFTERSTFDYADNVKSAVRSRVPWPLDFYEESIDGFRLDDAGYEKGLVETFRSSYGKQKLDLVIVMETPALQFAERHRDELFFRAPIVFLDVADIRFAGQAIPPGITGVTENVDVRATIDLAMRLHPDTSTVAIITNTSTLAKYWLGLVHNDLARRSPELTVVDLLGLPPNDLIARVDALPRQTIVLFMERRQESDRPAVQPYEALASVGQRLPTYCIFTELICLGQGGIGGATYDDIPIIHGKTSQIRVDWRQLRRWHIPESALPPGSVVLYREPTLWERDRNYIIAAVLIILAQSLLIAGLLWQRARKRKAEAVLGESEKRFRVMADTTPSLIWMADRNGKITYLNSKSVEFTGDPKAGFGNSWSEYVHPDDLDSVLSVNAHGLVNRLSVSKEYRLRRYDGVYRWMFDVASPRVNGDGSFAGFIGSAIDITDQKMAQDALENVSGRLIEAQEKERSRIARDLHDDICQRLALLSMELEETNRTLDNSSEAADERLKQIQQHCAEIAGDVQSLSHELHSSKLDYLGVAAGIRGLCKEFAKQHKVRVDFKDEGVPTHLPKDISLCLFRIAQEGLHNAVKYSGTTQFAVTLRKTANEVQLEVIDGGLGFDVEEAKRNRGLGLVSMQERVHLLHGALFIDSAPGKGTRVVASVPVVKGAEASVAVIGDEPTSITGVA